MTIRTETDPAAGPAPLSEEPLPSGSDPVNVPPTPIAEELYLRRRAFRILWLASRIFFSYFFHRLAASFVPRTQALAWQEDLHRKNAVRIKEAALSLKGLLIKVGQFMSARVDLLPDAYTQTLSLLQDQVPPAPYRTIRERFVQEFGAPPESLFETFNPVPLASASLGQVHEATLREDGRRVAVKVQYPEIEQIVETDLRALQWIVWALQKVMTNIRFDVLYTEFSKIVHKELDYFVEARQAELFHKNFSADPRIIVPPVVWKYTTGRILTLEFVEGIKISRIEEIRRAGIDSKAVATLLVESYMKQILQHRFFHGDPHPGNLFVRPGPQLVFVDFGLMQQIDAGVHRGMEKMIIAIIDRDIPGIARALLDLGFIARTERMDDVENVVRFFMDRYRDISPRAFKRITLTQVARDLETLFHVYPMLQVPNHFILVGRTAGMLNGLCSQLDPDLNIIEIAEPYAKKFVGMPNLTAELLSRGKEILIALIDLPVALRDFLEMGNTGQFRTRMNSEDLTGILTKIYKLAYRTVLAGFIVTMTLLYSNLVRSFNTPAGIMLSTLIVFPALALVYSFLRRR
ncbi:MAG: AarF/ABC1/UbiB kinase family protein [Nitrospirae bacterium]|nr:AarF/ABC1/UbiB kinase family protein [Candidatus Manganitrophaceae bacterium]